LGLTPFSGYYYSHPADHHANQYRSYFKLVYVFLPIPGAINSETLNDALMMSG